MRVHATVRWSAPTSPEKPIDAHRATGHFTPGVNTITAELRFNDDGDLVDLVSDDRAAG